MRQEEEEDLRDTSHPALTLALLHIPSTTMMLSPDHPSSPPLQTIPVSVPFRWEEEPGKPRSCTPLPLLLPLPPPFKLELPPGNKITRTPSPSPTTVVDGPSNVGRPKFSSFRWFREERLRLQDIYGSPDDDGRSSIIGVEELFGSSKKSGVHKRKGFFGRIKNGKRVVDAGSSCRFSPSSISSTGTCDSDYKNVRRSSASASASMGRNGSFSSLPDAKPSHFLASIYQGLKQVIQRRSGRKSSKEGQDN